MSFFLRRVQTNELRQRAADRLRALPRSSALDWAEVAVSGLYKCVDDLRKGDDPDALEEMERGLQQLLGFVDAFRSTK